jgi:putative transposase
MRKSRFSEAQIVAILKELKAGKKAASICRERGISDALQLARQVRRSGSERPDEAAAARRRESAAQEDRRRPSSQYRSLEDHRRGKLLRPAQRKAAVQAVQERLDVKERPACRWIGVNRKLLRYRSRRNDEPLRLRLIALANEHRRFGLPRLTVLLRRDGIEDNHKWIGRIYRAANLQVRKRVRRKLALGRGPVDAPALVPNERWSLDFVHDRLRTNRRFRVLAVGDDCTLKTSRSRRTLPSRASG